MPFVHDEKGLRDKLEKSIEGYARALSIPKNSTLGLFDIKRVHAELEMFKMTCYRHELEQLENSIVVIVDKYLELTKLVKSDLESKAKEIKMMDRDIKDAQFYKDKCQGFKSQLEEATPRFNQISAIKQRIESKHDEIKKLRSSLEQYDFGPSEHELRQKIEELRTTTRLSNMNLDVTFVDD